MKKKLITVYASAFTEKIKCSLWLCLLCAFAQTASAQTRNRPAQNEKNVCGITSAYSKFVNKRIIEKIAALRAAGKLPHVPSQNIRQANAPATPVSFRWPLADIKQRDFPSWRIMNFVDLDPNSINDGSNTNPAEIADYSCGDRCYDYHTGTDIVLEPYYWNEKTAKNTWVIAGAPGVIVDKHDGAFDEQCDPPPSICGSEPDNRGNYVVILHDDGSTASFYMHMVQNSLTTKQEGDRVNAGDYLGIAGSSGCSSGPHLHFEVRTGYVDAGTGYENTGTVVDPFANGSCAVSTSSWWITEPPYNDPAVLTMESHSSDPETFVEGSDWCDKTVLLYPDNSFVAGDKFWLRTKFRDWLDGSTATFNIYKPDGTAWRNYARTNPTTSRAYIPDDAGYAFTSSDPAGTYRYTVTFAGKTYSHYFTKDCQASLGLSGAVSGQKGYMVSDFISSFQTIAGLSSNYVKYMADNHVTLSPGFRATAGCRFVANTQGCSNSVTAAAPQNLVSNAVSSQLEADDKTQSAVKIFPNPSTGVFTIKYQQKDKFNAGINVRNMMGQVIHTIPSKEYNGQLLQLINITGKPKGMYLVEIVTANKRIIEKIILQ